MINIRILTDKNTSTNSEGFIRPILKSGKILNKEGYLISIDKSYKKKNGYDITIIESKYAGYLFRSKGINLIDILNEIRSNDSLIIYYDNSDSSGCINRDAIENVDIYLKNQILKDRDLYKVNFYGDRIHTDFSHNVWQSKDEVERHETYRTITDNDIKKIRVGWNSFSLDLSLIGMYRKKFWKNAPEFLSCRDFGVWRKASSYRTLELNVRMQLEYYRNTVTSHRKYLLEKLGIKAMAKKVNRWKYLNELSNSKIVLSPFGWGEINYRDWECLRAGCCLVKPSMSHIETWPNLFSLEEGAMYQNYSWDMKDAESMIRDTLMNERTRIAIAQKGQDFLRKYTISKDSNKLFANHFVNIIKSI